MPKRTRRRDGNAQLTNKVARLRRTLYVTATVLLLLTAGSAAVSKQPAALSGKRDNGGKTISAFAQCRICHASLDDFENPKITFRHESGRAEHADAGVKCATCHDREPHSAEERIVKPGGRTCQKCHDNNGTGPSASYRCSLCHPADFLAPFAAAETDYDHAGPQPSGGIRPEAKVDVTLPVTASKCAPCHVPGKASPAVRFNHGTHFRKGIQCFACHFDKPHEKGAPVRRPKMESCSVCHGLSHGAQGTVAPKQCGFCHRPGWRQKPATHTDRWLTEHKIEYKKGVNCLACHEKATCVSCHGMEQIPHPSNWRRTHEQSGPGMFRQVCMKCHQPDRVELCESCHHPDFKPEFGEWVSSRPGESVHPRFFEEKGGEYCLSCHSPSFCPQCHVKSDRQNLK